MANPLSTCQGPAETSFPGWRNPKLCRLVFTSTASGATVTVDPVKTTPGLSAGVFATNSFPMTFSKCKNAQVEKVSVIPATPATVGNHRQSDYDTPNAGAGTVNLYMVAANGGAFSAPQDGSIVEVLIWLDLG